MTPDEIIELFRRSYDQVPQGTLFDLAKVFVLLIVLFKLANAVGGVLVTSVHVLIVVMLFEVFYPDREAAIVRIREWLGIRTN